MKYMLLFEKLAKCNSGMTRAKTCEEIEQLQQDITQLISYFKAKFPQASFTPKLHILIRHVIGFIERTGASLGSMGEQGAESVHAKFNSLSSRMKGILNTKKSYPELQLLKAIVEEHLLLVHPSSRTATSGPIEE